MSIVVKNTSNEQIYVLLGCGRSEFQSMQPGNFGGSLKPDGRGGMSQMICVCDESGKIHWFDSEEIVVVSVDGLSVAQVHANATRPPTQFFGTNTGSSVMGNPAQNKIPEAGEQNFPEILTGVEVFDPEDAIRFLDS